MALLDAAIAHFTGVQRTLRLSPWLRRGAGLLGLLVVGGFQAHLLPALAKTPFYLIPLIPLAFLEPPPIAAAFAGLAALISLGADLRAAVASAPLVALYWSALARLIGFGLITTAISLAVRENGRLRRSEQALAAQAQALDAKNHALEKSLRALQRLQEALIATERQAAIAEAAQRATYETQRPLMSISAFGEELQRVAPPDAAGDPIAEQISAWVADIEQILQGVRDAREGKSP